MRKIQIIAVIFALLAGISAYAFFNSIQNSTQKGYINVVVAAVHIDSKTKITADMLKYIKLPQQAAHELAIKNIADAVGKITQNSLVPDEQLLSAQLISAGTDGDGFAYKIPDGKRAFTLAVDETSGVGGYLKVSDNVDVLAEFHNTMPTGERKSTSVLLLQNIEIIAAGSYSGSSTSSLTTYTNVTLAVTPEQAVKLELADATGKVRLSLRPPLESNTQSEKPQTTADIVK